MSLERLHQHPRLIIQMESLNRLNMQTVVPGVDLLILDEVESIISQMSSPLFKDRSSAFATFVCAMDANLGDRTYRVLERMRGPDITLHCNEYRNATKDKWYYTTDINKWNLMMKQALGDGKKIVTPCNSKKKAEEIIAATKKNFPECKTKLFSGETSPQEKRQCFGSPNEEFVKYDHLAYTPTLTAGVSFIDISYCLKHTLLFKKETRLSGKDTLPNL